MKSIQKIIWNLCEHLLNREYDIIECAYSFTVTTFLLNKCWSSIITIHAISWLLVLRWIIPQSSKITFMAFAMIGANIIPAVATIREESNRKGRKNPYHWLYCTKYDLVYRKSKTYVIACSQAIYQSSPKTSSDSPSGISC